MGRPRKIRQEDGSMTEEAENTALMVNGKPVLPYHGSDGLAEPIIDKRGKVKKAGEAKYFLNGNSNMGYKLIGVYKTGHGIRRRLVRVLKTRSQTKRGAADRVLLDQLRKAGIPGY